MINYNPNGLQSSDYEYAGDREALEALRKIPVLDKLMAIYLDFSIKSGMYIETAQDNFRVTPQTNPGIYSLYQIALDRLNMEKEPKLYIDLKYEYNAYATGIDDPYIVIHSSLVNDCTDEELLALIGHELGHIKSGHVLYYNMIKMLTSMLSSRFGMISPLINTGVMFALMDWSRKSEYTADRAGRIACGSLDASVDSLARLMGKGPCDKYVDFSTERMLEQHEDFDMTKDGIIGKLIYVTQTAVTDHPWTVNRIKKLIEWEDSEQLRTLSEKTALLTAGTTD